METPREEGDRLAELCADKAENESSFNREQAGDLIINYLRQVGQPVSGEVLVNHCVQAGQVPHDARAFGAVFGVLARAKRIVTVGFCTRQKGHGTAGARLWQLVDGEKSNGRVLGE